MHTTCLKLLVLDDFTGKYGNHRLHKFLHMYFFILIFNFFCLIFSPFVVQSETQYVVST